MESEVSEIELALRDTLEDACEAAARGHLEWLHRRYLGAREGVLLADDADALTLPLDSRDFVAEVSAKADKTPRLRCHVSHVALAAPQSQNAAGRCVEIKDAHRARGHGLGAKRRAQGRVDVPCDIGPGRHHENVQVEGVDILEARQRPIKSPPGPRGDADLDERLQSWEAGCELVHALTCEGDRKATARTEYALQGTGADEIALGKPSPHAHKRFGRNSIVACEEFEAQGLTDHCETATDAHIDFKARSDIVSMTTVNNSNVNGISCTSAPSADVFATLRQLDKNARLFVDSGNGYTRIGAADAYRHLAAETPIIIVNASSRVEKFASQAGSGASDRSYVWGQTVSASSGSGRHSSRSTSASFTTESVQSLNELALVDLDIAGIPGAGVLPKNGGPVVTSTDFEAAWQSRSASVKAEIGGTRRYTGHDESRFERVGTRAIR